MTTLEAVDKSKQGLSKEKKKLSPFETEIEEQRGLENQIIDRTKDDI